MPSSSNVLKNDRVDSISQFTFSGLNEFTRSVKPEDEKTDRPTNQVEAAPIETHDPVAQQIPVGLAVNHASGSHRIKETESIHPWSVSEFIKDNPRKSEKSVPQKVEDYSYLITEAKTKADEIISEAERNAAEIIAQAKTEAESLKQKAFMEGMNTAKNESSGTIHQVGRIFQETQLWQEQVMHQSQNRIMEMVLAIGKKLFGGGFELPAGQIDHVISRAINEASRLGNLRIYMHPEDAKLLVNLWQESEITLNGQQIQIVSSQNISRGGCFVDGQFGIVDGRVEEQVDQISTAIKSAEINLEVEE